MNTDEGCDLSINFWLLFSTKKFFQLLTVRKIPYLHRTICRRSYQSTTISRKSSGRDLWVISLLQPRIIIGLGLELWHEFSIFNVPYRNESTVITRDDSIEMSVISGKSYCRFVTRLNLLLCLERPELYWNRANKNVMQDWVVMQRS